MGGSAQFGTMTDAGHIVRRHPLLRASPALACIACFLLQLMLFWPGLADYDTINVYEQILNGIFSNWHPPILGAIWRVFLLTPLEGTSGPYLLQVCMFWAGVGGMIFGLRGRDETGPAFAVLAACLIPVVFGFETVVIKDAQLTSAVLCATGIWSYFTLRGKPVPIAPTVVIALLLTYAMLVRFNAIFAVFPLGLMMAAGRQGGTARTVRMSFAGMAMLVLVLSGPFINESLLGATDEHPERQISLYDLAGITHYGHLETMPGVSVTDWRRAERRNCYQPFYWDPYGSEDGCPWIFEAAFNRGALWTDWISTIAAHPFPYARHRLAHFNTTLRWLVPSGQPRASTNAQSELNPYGLGVTQNFATKFSHRVQKVAEYTPLSWPIFWFALGWSLLIFVFRKRSLEYRSITFALLLSALCVESSFLVISISSDLRYHHWAITAISVAAALVFSDRSMTRQHAWRLLSFPAAITLAGSLARFVLTPAWP